MHDDLLQFLYQPIVALYAEPQAQYQLFFQLVDEKDGTILECRDIYEKAKITNLLSELDRFVIHKAIAIYEQKKLENQDVKIFISQNYFELHHTNCIQWLSEMNFDGLKNLVFEFQYVDLMENLKISLEFLRELKILGISSSVTHLIDDETILLQSLQHLPVEYVKDSYDLFQENPELLKNLISFCQQNNKSVIVSGVNDAPAVVPLWSANVDFMQGDFLQVASESLEFDFSSSMI
jgi:EAL domain-containing protein (putative c-di-GMP-specific phosphodiesterase class I)